VAARLARDGTPHRWNVAQDDDLFAVPRPRCAHPLERGTRSMPSEIDVIRYRGGHAQLIGYARVSTKQQNLASQLDALKKAGCCRVYCEKVSGAAARRPALAAMLDTLRPKDIVVIVALDRLGRRLSELIHTLETIRENGCHLRALRHAIDTSAPQGKVFTHFMAVIAEIERDYNRERTREGLAAAAVRGRHPGRPVLLTPAKIEQISHLRSHGHSLRAIADAVHLSEKSVRKALALREERDPRQLRML
jgi:DNA invertase Pin-like site-specific DNA recombinase